MKRYSKAKVSQIRTGMKVEGESIEMKVERIVLNKEPIKDGAPEIYTDRNEGVIAAYNVRTDRWEIACEAMTVGEKSKIAKREAIEKAAEEKKAAKDTKTSDSGTE